MLEGIFNAELPGAANEEARARDPSFAPFSSEMQTRRREVKLVGRHRKRAARRAVFSHEPWRPKDHCTVNGQEFFPVWKGRFRVELRNHLVGLGPGECVGVPKGVEPRTAPRAKLWCCVLNRLAFLTR
jgi:uncharacterized cupin superfamily protein